MSSNYCPNCGKKMENSGINFCPHCGQNLRGSAIISSNKETITEEVPASINFAELKDKIKISIDTSEQRPLKFSDLISEAKTLNRPPERPTSRRADSSKVGEDVLKQMVLECATSKTSNEMGEEIG